MARSSWMGNLVAFVLLAWPLRAQSSQTLPSGFEVTPGNTTTNYPVNTNNSQIWQWHYANSNFAQGRRIRIDEIYVRAESPAATVSAFNFPDFTVTCSEATTQYTVASHDPNFANNLGANTQVVRSGPWSGGPVGPSSGATATWIPLGVTAPFVFDPTHGNDLIIQVQKCAAGSIWGTPLDTKVGTTGTNGGNRYGDWNSCTSTVQNTSNNEAVPIVRIDYTVLSGSQTLPIGFDDVQGNAYTNYPLNTHASQVWQWHYANSNFAQGQRIRIDEIYVRASSPTASVSAFSFPNFTVTCSEATTQYTVASHDPTFANNLGANTQVVRSGPWSGGPVGPSGGPASTWIALGVTAPFEFDPAHGNDLIIQVEKCAAGSTWGTSLDVSTGPAGANAGNRYGHASNCTATVQSTSNNEAVPIVRIDYTIVGGSQTLPSGFDVTPGNAYTNYPLDTNASQIWQWHYANSSFAQGRRIRIDEIYVRAASPGATVSAFSFPDFTVTCSEATTQYTFASHDPTFANNLGANTQVVRSGPWSGGPVGPSGGQSATWIPLGVTAPFIFDPTHGNDLIIQVKRCAAGSIWGTSMDVSTGPAGTNGGNRYGHNFNCTATVQTFYNNEAVPIVRIDYTFVGGSQTLPIGFDAVPGNNFTYYPFNTHNSQIAQWHYANSNFAQGLPITIHEIYVRAASPVATVAAFNFPDLTVTCSEATTQYTVASHDPVFALNIGANTQVVRSGPWSGGPVGPSGGSTATWIPLGVTVPFVFDPTHGSDLLVQVEKCAPGALWNTSLDISASPAGTNGGNRYYHVSSCTATVQNTSNNEAVPILRIDYTIGEGAVAYCTAGTSTHGCVPTIVGVGTPSVARPSGYSIQVAGLEGQMLGLIFYGVSGRVASPWGQSSSYFCVKAPVARMNVQSAGGTSGACNGSMATDWLAFISAHPGAVGAPFAAGQAVNAQGWYRDPPSPKTTNLTGGLQFVTLP